MKYKFFHNQKPHQTQLQQSSEYGKNNNIEHKRSMSSMELQEQQTLERMALQNELETKLEERKRSLNSSLSSRDSDSGSVVSSNGANDKSSDDPMHLMERRHMRSFNRADEYLYAMKEDLAEWLNMLYIEIDIDAENFLGKLETGELLVKETVITPTTKWKTSTQPEWNQSRRIIAWRLSHKNSLNNIQK
jgi:hypothetical protein